MAAPAAAADAVFGTFTLDPARSSGREVCAVTTLEDLGSGKFHFVATRVTASGKFERRDGVFAFDGGEHSDGIGSLAFSRVDEHRYVMVSLGRLHATTMVTLSDDGTVLTETADGIDDDDAFHAARVYVRGAGKCDAVP